jgi:hypothetical protein
MMRDANGSKNFQLIAPYQPLRYSYVVIASFDSYTLSFCYLKSMVIHKVFFALGLLMLFNAF